MAISCGCPRRLFDRFRRIAAVAGGEANWRFRPFSVIPPTTPTVRIAAMAVIDASQLAYMDPSSVASIPFFGNEVRLLTYIRPLTAASI
jgi:hypothetical protein